MSGVPGFLLQKAVLFTAKYNSNNDSQSSSADTAASDSDIVDMNSSASDDTDAETYDESYDTDNSDAE